MPSLYQTPPRPSRRSRAPLEAQRRVTPNRSNKRGFKNPVIDMQLVKDVDSIKSHTQEDFKFVWHKDLFDGLDRDKLRKRYYYFRDLKCNSSTAVWQGTVDWADTVLLAQDKSELIDMGEFSH